MSGKNSEKLDKGKSNSRTMIFEGHTKPLKCIMVSPDGRWILSGGNDGLRMWDLTRGKRVRKFDLFEVGLMSTSGLSLSISPDSRWALSAVSLVDICNLYWSRLDLWDLATGKCVKSLKLDMELVRYITFSPDGRLALSAGRDTLGFWDLTTGKRVKTFEGLTEGESFISISRDGHWALSLGYESLRLWELDTGKCIRTFDRDSLHTNDVCCIGPDRRWALSGGVENKLLLWELATGKCVQTFKGHTDKVNSVSISPDNQWGLSGSRDKTMRLWELATGKCVRIFEGHKNWVYSVTFSTDGRYVLSGSSDKILRLWELI
jgi:WD40 repeat protein